MMNLEIANAGQPDYEQLHLGWFLVDWCNYKCTYCSVANRLREVYSKDESNSKYKLVLERLDRVDTSFDMDIYGGEPTLHPNFNEILERLAVNPHCRTIEVKTNLSRSINFYQDMFAHDKVSMSASYHFEYHSQEFIDKCIALKENNFSCHISMPDQPKHWDAVLDLINTFDLHGVKYDCNILFSTGAYKTNYTDQFYKTFGHVLKSAGPNYRYQFVDGQESSLSVYQIKQQGLDNFNNYRCKALMYEINTEGDIQNMCTGNALPLIFKKQDTHKIVKCPLTSCSCDVMFNFYKEKTNGTI
jgi:4Fe-4S single cluster domain